MAKFMMNKNKNILQIYILSKIYFKAQKLFQKKSRVIVFLNNKGIILTFLKNKFYRIFLSFNSKAKKMDKAKKIQKIPQK